MEVLVFEHPLAGVQLIKGTLEPGESLPTAALRELNEETGVAHARWVSDLGAWDAEYEEQIWHFQECKALEQLPESWSHYAQDDGGHVFRVFWHPIHAEPGQKWHPVHARALEELRARILERGDAVSG